MWVFPGGSVVKTLPANAGDTDLIPRWGRSPGEGNGKPLQYFPRFSWENQWIEEPTGLQSMGWQKSRSQISDWTTSLHVVALPPIDRFYLKSVWPFRFMVLWLSGKELACQCRRCGFNPCVGKTPWRRKWQPTPAFSPGESHGQGSLVDYGPQGCKTVRHDLETEKQQAMYNGAFQTSSTGKE